MKPTPLLRKCERCERRRPRTHVHRILKIRLCETCARWLLCQYRHQVIGPGYDPIPHWAILAADVHSADRLRSKMARHFSKLRALAA
ncbi:MAG: hypothetical protein E6J20_00480 [Chloroflexi bacterium]|nr:MAG: hypothetical protein E6J20_00480 [Chloroflexota bacterium]